MDKKLVRSYSIGNEGDLFVKGFDKDGRGVDMSGEYQGLPLNRRQLKADVYLDVFRYEDGELTWSGSANGHEPPNAISFKLLLDAFTQDLTQEGPRAF